MGALQKAKDLYGKGQKKNAFMTGALVLAAAGAICRVLGLAFRIPLVNIIGNYGMGLYQMVWPIYALLLVISSAGIPVAISKLVARENTEGNHKESRRILKSSLCFLVIVGAVFAIALAALAIPIATLQGNPKVAKIYMAIAPSIFFVCLIAAFRGYFQGMQNMVPTAVSQVLEQFVKVLIGISLAILLNPFGAEWAVFGAIVALTIAEFCTLVYQALKYRKSVKASGGEKVKASRKLAFKVLRASLPITGMAAIFPLILVADSLMVIRILQASGETNHTATQLFGISTGNVHTLINMPAVLGIAIATAVVPTVSSLLKQGKKEELNAKCALAIRLITLITLYFAVFYLIFANRVLGLLYFRAFKDNAEHLALATRLLRIESAMIFLMGLSSVFAAMMQGAAKARFPLIALACGGAAKITLQLILLPTNVGIYAISLGNVLCFLIAAVLNCIFAMRVFSLRGKIWGSLWRVALLVPIYFFSLLLINWLLPDGKWWIVLGGAAAFILYVLLVWLLRFFPKAKKAPV